MFMPVKSCLPLALALQAAVVVLLSAVSDSIPVESDVGGADAISVSVYGLRNALRSLPHELEDVDAFVARFDKDENHQIDYEEFLAAMNSPDLPASCKSKTDKIAAQIVRQRDSNIHVGNSYVPSMSAVTVPMHGGVSDVGQFFITMQIGAGGQLMTAQVDTGSSTVAFPATGCQQTDRGHPCNDKIMYTGLQQAATSGVERLQCAGVDCKFRLSYADGSGVRGTLVKDRAVFVLQDGATGMQAPIVFGAIDEEVGQFQEFPEINGILGMAGGGPAYPGGGESSGRQVSSLIGQLVAQKMCRDQFGICLGQGGGTMVLGGVDPTAYHGDLQYVKMLPGDEYVIQVQSVTLTSTHEEAPAQACADDLHWEDSDGDACAKYGGGNCKRADVSDFAAKDGRSALQACPYTCGLCFPRKAMQDVAPTAELISGSKGIALVDSGTTKLILTEAIFEKFVAHVKSTCAPEKVCKLDSSGQPDAICASTIKQMVAMVDKASCYQSNLFLRDTCFPTLDFAVTLEDGSASVLSVQPKQYIYVLVDKKKSYHCPAVKAHSGMITLGDAFMQTYYTDFDRANHRMGFATANIDKCGGSSTCGEYSFNGVGIKGDSLKNCASQTACFWCHPTSTCVSADNICPTDACSNHLKREGSRCDSDGDGTLDDHIGMAAAEKRGTELSSTSKNRPSKSRWNEPFTEELIQLPDRDIDTRTIAATSLDTSQKTASKSPHPDQKPVEYPILIIYPAAQPETPVGRRVHGVWDIEMPTLVGTNKLASRSHVTERSPGHARSIGVFSILTVAIAAASTLYRRHMTPLGTSSEAKPLLV